ncbi:MAG TPA: hypothetical protein EYN66_18630 [Myxococcales bacterium]|nr:hypothetical protein [Myxococcales bacterium]
MTICKQQLIEQEIEGKMRIATGWKTCNTKMIFSLERRTWYCPECGNSVRVPREQQSLNEYTR